MPLPQMVAAFGFAAAFFVVGLWGRRKADELVPSALSEPTRRKRRRVLVRGAVASMVVGVLVVAMVVATLVHSLLA